MDSQDLLAALETQVLTALRDSTGPLDAKETQDQLEGPASLVSPAPPVQMVPRAPPACPVPPLELTVSW